MDVAAGIFWGQTGGNWFMADNVISNYGLEGNHYETYVSLVAAVALNGAADWTSVNGTSDDPQDYSMYFVGSVVDGGRYAESRGILGDVRNTLHVTGNSITVVPGFPRSDDAQSAALWLRVLAFGNISGNTLLAGECGITWSDSCTNTLVLKNDFRTASWRALDYQGNDEAVRNVHAIKNVLNQGKSYHLKLPFPDSGAFLLQRNIYTNGLSTVDPFFDAAASPVHIMR